VKSKALYFVHCHLLFYPHLFQLCTSLKTLWYRALL